MRGEAPTKTGWFHLYSITVLQMLRIRRVHGESGNVVVCAFHCCIFYWFLTLWLFHLFFFLALCASVCLFQPRPDHLVRFCDSRKGTSANAAAVSPAHTVRRLMPAALRPARTTESASICHKDTKAALISVSARTVSVAVLVTGIVRFDCFLYARVIVSKPSNATFL